MDVRALPVFEDAAAWWRPGINLVDPGLEPARVSTIEVSGNLFALLGVTPQAGAGFPAGGPLFAPRELIAVISDRLWRTRYGADPSVIGRPLLLNDEPYTVVGVMPPGFHYPDDVDVWQRLRWDMTQHSRAAHFMEAVARMKAGRHGGAGPGRGRCADRPVPDRVPADQPRLGHAAGAATRRDSSATTDRRCRCCSAPWPCCC